MQTAPTATLQCGCSGPNKCDEYAQLCLEYRTVTCAEHTGARRVYSCGCHSFTSAGHGAVDFHSRCAHHRIGKGYSPMKSWAAHRAARQTKLLACGCVGTRITEDEYPPLVVSPSAVCAAHRASCLPTGTDDRTGQYMVFQCGCALLVLDKKYEAECHEHARVTGALATDPFTPPSERPLSVGAQV